MSDLFNYICSYDTDRKSNIIKLLSHIQTVYESKTLITKTKIYKLCGLLYGTYYIGDKCNIWYATLDVYDGFTSGSVKYYDKNNKVVLGKSKKNKLLKIYSDRHHQEISNFLNDKRHGINIYYVLNHIGYGFYCNGEFHGIQYLKHEHKHERYINNYKYGKPHKYFIEIKNDNKCKIEFYNNGVLRFTKFINL